MLNPQTFRLLSLLSLLVGIAALLVPLPSDGFYHRALVRLLVGLGYEHDEMLKCPLGYGQQGDLVLAGGGLAKAVRVFTNCTVWTGDPQNPRAEALAVGGDGRFVYVGSSAAVTHAAPAAAELVNLDGGFVIPGLVDAHVHLIGGGLSLARLDLRRVRSRADFIVQVCTAAGSLQPGEWLLGGNWDESGWGGELPAAGWVDACTAQNPMFLSRMDGHMGLANSAALSLAGVTMATADPQGGVIARDAQGSPTGLLADNAMPLVMGSIPRASQAQRRDAFRAAVRHALSKGVTMVHDMGRVAFHEGEEAAWEDLEQVYIPAADAGELPIRLYSFVPLTTWRRMVERVRHVGFMHPGGRLQWGGVKEFSDGSLGSHTALMHEPYADKPSTSGTRTIELDTLKELVAKADAANLQVAIHAIGDRAVDDVLDIYAALPPLASNASSDGDPSGRPSGSPGGGAAAGSRTAPRRHRIEHAQHLSGRDAAQRMAALGVLATPNPLHLLADAAILGRRLGSDRAGPGRAYAFKTLMQAGVTSAFASDWPVVPLDALGTLQAAVHRRAVPLPGTGGSCSSAGGSGEAAAAGGSVGAQGGGSAAAGGPGPEAVSYGEALRASTVEGARAAFWEQDVGTIKPGMLADFVVLSAPLDSLPSVEQTYVDGECAYGCSSGSTLATGRSMGQGTGDPAVPAAAA